jgi:integrase
VTLVLTATGMRVGEVSNLKNKDVNLNDCTIMIRNTKSGKDRFIPIHQSLSANLLSFKNNYGTSNPEDYFFSFNGSQFSRNRFYDYFERILVRCKIKKEMQGKGFRVHDLRHTFAVRCLLMLSKSIDDVNLSISYLSIYLGHTGLQETQRYIWMTKELFEDTLEKTEKYTDFIDDIMKGETYEK